MKITQWRGALFGDSSWGFQQDSSRPSVFAIHTCWQFAPCDVGKGHRQCGGGGDSVPGRDGICFPLGYRCLEVPFVLIPAANSGRLLNPPLDLIT